MKIKDGFVLKTIPNSNIVVPLGSNVVDFSCVIKLSDSGAFLWNALSSERSFDDLLYMMLDEYDVDKDIATRDINTFINKLKDNNLLE